MKKLIVGVAAALTLTTSNAVADGITKRQPPTIIAPQYEPPPAPTWTGFYLGAGVGAGAVIHDFRVFDDDGTIARHDGWGGDGVFGTVIIGYDWQVGASTVFGLFVDYDFTDISKSFSLFNGLITRSVDQDNVWSVGARLGLLTSPSALWYITGGYTQAQFGVSVIDNINGVTLSRDRTFDGWFIGAGIDTRLAASNWFLRLEYRYSEFDSERFLLDDDTGLGHHFEPSVHSARLVLTYKMGGGYGWTMGR